jgi:uncharacterized protein
VVRRQQQRGTWGVRRVLWRRAAALVVIGFCHAVLLYVGDILAAYGVLLALGAWVVWWRDRRLLVLAVLFFVLTALPDGAALTDAAVGPGAAELPPDPWTAIVERLPVQPFIMLLGPIGFACPFLLGLWAGRRRILEPPREHRRLLGVVAVTGITVGILGAQPLSLVLAGAVPIPGTAGFSGAVALHTATGVFGGAGYAAAFTLLATRLTEPGPVAGALAATVVLADVLARTGHRGPFERLLRRVTYGRP